MTGFPHNAPQPPSPGCFTRSLCVHSLSTRRISQYTATTRSSSQTGPDNTEAVDAAVWPSQLFFWLFKALIQIPKLNLHPIWPCLWFWSPCPALQLCDRVQVCGWGLLFSYLPVTCNLDTHTSLGQSRGWWGSEKLGSECLKCLISFQWAILNLVNKINN